MMDCTDRALARVKDLYARSQRRGEMIGYIVEYLDILLDHDPDIRILGEMKPNEPMDQAYCPTVGHFMGLTYKRKTLTAWAC